MADEIIQKGDEYILIDVNGLVRLPERIKIDVGGIKEIAEIVYLRTRKNVGVKKIDVSFQELDNITHKTKNRGPGRRWTNEEEEYMLLHSQENDEVIGEGISRSGFAIHQHLFINKEFENWQHEEGKEFVMSGESREKLIKRFVWNDPDHGGAE